MLVVLLCSVEGWWSRRRRRGRWTTDARVNVGNTGVPSVSGSATYKGKNWEVTGSGSIDANKNWNVGVGATWRFKKRNMQVCRVYLNTAKTPKLRKDTQRHSKTGKDAQRQTKTRKGSKKTFEVDKDTQRRTKTRKNLRVFARVCVSLRVFACLCATLRVFA